jgi:hypothetical protein
MTTWTSKQFTWKTTDAPVVGGVLNHLKDVGQFIENSRQFKIG